MCFYIVQYSYSPSFSTYSLWKSSEFSVHMFFLFIEFFSFLFSSYQFNLLNFLLLRPACLQKLSYIQKANFLPLFLWNQTNTIWKSLSIYLKVHCPCSQRFSYSVSPLLTYPMFFCSVIFFSLYFLPSIGLCPPKSISTFLLFIYFGLQSCLSRFCTM